MRTAIATATIAMMASVNSTAVAACNIVNGVAYGDCSGVTVNTGKSAFVVVHAFVSLTGISEGAQVLSGGSLSVSGIADRVIVEPGGAAYISGIVESLIVGGTATVSGQVNSILLLDGARVTVTGVVGQIAGNGTARLETGSVVSGIPTPFARDVTLN